MPSAEQLQNAAIIYRVGRQMGMSSRDIQIGLITAMTESNLINVNYGDRDSLGLFQQRPSMGWGTPAQVTNPEYAAGKFFSALKGLGESRYQMGMGEAAQAVQRSAYPDRYAEHLGAMRAMWPTVMRAGGDTPKSLDGGDYGSGGSVPNGSPYGFNVVTNGPDNSLLIPESQFPDVQIPLVTPGSVLDAAYGGDLNTAVSPTAKQMLGSWGMGGVNLPPSPNDSVTSQQQYITLSPDQLYGDIAPIINTSTNQSIIQPLMQTTGGYTKGVDGWRKAVIDYAKSAIGTPYVWGGTNLQGGVDCSGLIYAAFQKAGISMPRISYQQANSGQRVGINQLQPGDLVAWDNSSRNPGADHIALYIGGGQILEAARPGTTVRIRSLGSGEGGWGVRLNK